MTLYVSPRGRITSYLPTDPHATYAIRDQYDRVIYIGNSHFPESRVETHRSEKSWRREIADWSVIEWHPDRDTACAAEHSTIWRYDPDHNTVGTAMNVIVNRAPWGPEGHTAAPHIIADARALRAERIAAEKAGDWDAAQAVNLRFADICRQLGVPEHRVQTIAMDRFTVSS